MPAPSRTPPAAATSRPRVDPRGQLFAAAVTVAVLAAVLLTLGTQLSVLLLAWQGIAFAVGAAAGPGRTPYAWVYRRAVRPRLRPPDHLEDAAPPRFAQGVGLAFALAGLGALLAGSQALAAVAVGAALAAAFLNAAFGFCLGCEVYLVLRRAVPARSAGTPGPAPHRPAPRRPVTTRSPSTTLGPPVAGAPLPEVQP
jgi:hypothetical protein